MSVSGFVIHGYHKGLVMTRDGGLPFGEIRLYDIGEDDLIGAQYVIDGSKQAQPLDWHPGVARALRHHRGGDGTARPTLRKSHVEPLARSASATPSGPDNESGRPSLKKQRAPKKMTEEEHDEASRRKFRLTRTKISLSNRRKLRKYLRGRDD